MYKFENSPIFWEAICVEMHDFCIQSLILGRQYALFCLSPLLYLCMSQIQECPSPPPATPEYLTRTKSRMGGNLTFVQVPVPRAFDTMKKTSQHLVYPNNMHQYQSRQQCNHVSSVKYRKQEQILKILDTMNQRSQFYNVLKYQ